MKIKQVMTPSVKVVRPDATLREAAKLMDEVDVGALPVCDGDRLQGLITDRDIVIRSVSIGQDPTLSVVRDAMTSPIDFCFENDNIEEVAAKMRKKQIRRLAVIDSHRRLAGMISLGDIAIASSDDQLTAETTRGVSSDFPTLSKSSFKYSNIFGWIAAGFLGGALVYLFDPVSGSLRRERVVQFGSRFQGKAA